MIEREGEEKRIRVWVDRTQEVVWREREREKRYASKKEGRESGK